MSNCYKYYEFNKKVYEEFFKKNLHSNHHAAVIFSDITKVETFDEFEGACQYLGDNTWQDLVKHDVNGIPKYLGIIALQIYALSLRMSNSDEHPKGAYNPELSKLLGGITEQKLQNRYRNAQEDVFTEFETWCQKNGVGIKYFINSGRKYVSYPLSFPILHKGDCLKLKNIFRRCSLPVNGDYEFDDFCKLLCSDISKNFPVLSEKDEFSQAFWLQIYLFYKNWDGTAPENNNSQKQRELIQYHLKWDGSEKIELFPNKYKFDSLLNRYKGKGCFFQRDSYGDWHFIRADVIESENDTEWFLYICVRETSISKHIEDTASFYQKREFDFGKIYVFGKGLLGILLKKYGVPIKLKDGIKVKPWSQIWLEGAGPVIDAPDDFAGKVTLIHCSTSQKIDCFSPGEQKLIDLPRGAYKLRYSADPDDIIYFEIRNVLEIRNADQPSNKIGWNFAKNKLLQVAEENGDIHFGGLNFSNIPAELFERDLHKLGNPCRIWMDLAATGKSPEYSNDNLIHKSLRRAKNGLHIR